MIYEFSHKMQMQSVLAQLRQMVELAEPGISGTMLECYRSSGGRWKRVYRWRIVNQDVTWGLWTDDLPRNVVCIEYCKKNVEYRNMIHIPVFFEFRVRGEPWRVECWNRVDSFSELLAL